MVPILRAPVGALLRSLVPGAALVLGAVLVWAGPLAAEPLEVLYQPRAPYYVETVGRDGRLDVGGLVGGPAGRALEAAGIEVGWQQAPFNRQITLIRTSDQPLCALGWFETPERRRFARFSAPLYRDLSQIALATEPLPSDTLRGLLGRPGLRLGIKLGYSYGPYADGLIAATAPAVVSTSQDTLGMLRMLVGGRFDLMLISAEEASEVLRTFEERHRVISHTLKDLPPGQSRHLMCTMAVPEATLTRINRALTRLANHADKPPVGSREATH
ncbi:substrate-binding periplasmic protein [Roseospirillum parvum]|uniref:Polar amino acid transport system substrate-binding protein n=1 Tax=Roseospirillum parvum TaxID=83401 RepID=A0A1G7V8X0_9PROT|nr:transporter substrate-binding domain-containing protein [Roseospirillum parvum]SDG56236.1 polar amino acid transport system substrate-binding protein [Roseospirillum parvum]